MADADEDTLTHPPTSTLSSVMETDPTDPTDEQPDFRFLSPNQTQSLLPKRGTKDFEPNPTLAQADALTQSRQAMHTTLAHPRIHMPKTHIVGYYLPDDVDERADGRCVRIDEFKSVNARTMGVADRWNRVWLWPEEALWLLERGTVDIRWKVRDQDVEDDGGEEEDLPMSLQAAYATLIGNSGLTLERFLVYANLKRLGYNVVRAPTWHEDSGRCKSGNGHLQPPASANGQLTRPTSSPQTSKPRPTFNSLIHRLLHWLLVPDPTHSRPATGPVVAPGLYRNYNDIFRALALVPYHQHSNLPKEPPPRPPFQVCFNVYKPSTSFRKSTPGEPDFRITVLDARSSSVPTLTQIGSLLDSMPVDEVPGEGKRVEQRLKHGRRNAILAVVDSGVVSYLRASDALFGDYRIYEEKSTRNRKGGRAQGNRKR